MGRESQSYQLLQDGAWRGPYTFAQVRELWRSGRARPTTAYEVIGSSRSGALAEMAGILGPVSDDASSAAVEAMPQLPAIPAPHPEFKRSTLASVFQALGVVELFAAAVGLGMMLVGNAREQATGQTMLALGFSGGLLLLALAKIIDCLHEITFRIRNLEQMARKAQE